METIFITVSDKREIIELHVIANECKEKNEKKSGDNKFHFRRITKTIYQKQMWKPKTSWKKRTRHTMKTKNLKNFKNIKKIKHYVINKNKNKEGRDLKKHIILLKRKNGFL